MAVHAMSEFKTKQGFKQHVWAQYLTKKSIKSIPANCLHLS